MIDPLIFIKDILENNWNISLYGEKPQIVTLQKFKTQISDKGIIYLHSVRANVKPFDIGITYYSNKYTIVIDVWCKTRTRLDQIIQAIIEILFKKSKELNNPFKIVIEDYEDFSKEVFGAQRGLLTVEIEDYTPL